MKKSTQVAIIGAGPAGLMHSGVVLSDGERLIRIDIENLRGVE